MSNLQRRPKKLEKLVTDGTGLVPGSRRWLAYWTERLHQYIARDDDAKDYKFPLEVIRAYVQAGQVNRRCARISQSVPKGFLAGTN